MRQARPMRTTRPCCSAWSRAGRPMQRAWASLPTPICRPQRRWPKSANTRTAQAQAQRGSAAAAHRPPLLPLQTPEFVLSFLHRLLHELHPLALQELDGLRREKALDGGREAGQQQPTVHAWDAAFYIGRVKARLFELESAALSRFFSLSNALRGLDLVFRSLFNCSLTQREMSAGEDWTEAVPGRHRQEVVKLELRDEATGAQLGRVYLDLLARDDKFRGGAAFVVQSARQLQGGPERQLPIMTVVAGFPRPTEAEDEDELRLSHGRLETLFHEMGHVAHHWSAEQQTADSGQWAAGSSCRQPWLTLSLTRCCAASVATATSTCPALEASWTSSRSAR